MNTILNVFGIVPRGYNTLLDIQKHNTSPKTAVFRHNMEELIIPLCCAECLPFLWQAAAVLYIGFTRVSSSKVAVFVWAQQTHKEIKNEEHEYPAGFHAH